jgi:hypothetical protein
MIAVTRDVGGAPSLGIDYPIRHITICRIFVKKQGVIGKTQSLEILTPYLYHS